jgi:hypothetical protein
VTPLEILQAALAKAISMGFVLEDWWEESMAGHVPRTPRTAAVALLPQHDWLKLLFTYEFAWPLFGGEARDDPEGAMPDWQYHLRELAALGFDEERLSYLDWYLRREHQALPPDGGGRAR